MEEGRYFYSKEEYQEYLDKEYNTKMDESQSYDRFKPNPLSGSIPVRAFLAASAPISFQWVSLL